MKYTDDGHIDLDQEDYRVDGEKLTEAKAEQLGEEIAGRLIGRPSLSSGRSPQIAFRVAAEVKAALDRLARERGTTPSEVAREALEKYLKAS